MLVLSRKEGEKLVIGNDITLVVSRISGNRVSIGIEAPRDVKIFRGELNEEPQTQRREILPIDELPVSEFHDGIDGFHEHLDGDDDEPSLRNVRFERQAM